MDLERLRKIFPPVERYSYISRLARPFGKIDIILDTDAYNEIDDQYALAYMIRSNEVLDVKAICATPFWRDPATTCIQRSIDPGDGMQKSYQEIKKLLDLLNTSALKSNVYRGSDRYLSSIEHPVDSEAARKIIEISKDYSKEHPLCIAALGCLTNIASALLLDPTLRDRIMISWLGGHAHHFGTCNDFNMAQDIISAQVLFMSGTPIIQLPLFGVVSEFRFSKPELESLFRGKNALCNYLIDSTFEFAKYKFDYEMWTKPLWDIAVVAWFVNQDFFLDRIALTPIPHHDFTYSFLPDMHSLRYVYYVFKDKLTIDLVRKLTQ